jgi:hypothetical protein
MIIYGYYAGRMDTSAHSLPLMVKKNELFRAILHPGAKVEQSFPHTRIVVTATADCSENYLFREKIVNFYFQERKKGDQGETDDTR